MAVRILIAHSFYRVPGGEDRYVRQQLELLRGSHDVDLLSAKNDELDASPATVGRMVYSRQLIDAAEAKLRRARPDVVHVHNIYPALGPAVHLAAARIGVPIVMTVHNYRLRCPNGLMFTDGELCRRCERGVYAHAVMHRCFPSKAQAGAYAVALWTHRFLLRLENTIALFIAPSVFAGRELQRWGIDRERIRVIRNFTDLKMASSAAPGEFGIYAGRLSQEKGLDVLLRALKLAGDPPFTVVGDGPEKGRLELLASDLGLQGVRFLGRVSSDDVRPLIEQARFVAFPSLWHENAPIAALEAMVSGRPLLVTRNGGLPELADGGRGLVCSPGDAHDLADKIRLLGDDDELCRRAGESALAFAREELRPTIHKSRLEEAYLAATGLARGPAPDDPDHRT